MLAEYVPRDSTLYSGHHIKNRPSSAHKIRAYLRGMIARRMSLRPPNQIAMPGDSQLQCIYCLGMKPAAEFNREHVVPAAFGSFKDALVLGDCVCESCNTYFGANLDLTLARSSDEGFQRYVWNVRPPEQIEQFKYDSVTFRYNGEGDYRGCLLRLTADPEAPNEFRATPIDQVGFPRRDEKGFVWIALDEVLKGAWINRDDLNPQVGIKIYARDRASAIAYLEQQGVTDPFRGRPFVSGSLGLWFLRRSGQVGAQP